MLPYFKDNEKTDYFFEPRTKLETVHILGTRYLKGLFWYLDYFDKSYLVKRENRATTTRNWQRECKLKMQLLFHNEDKSQPAPSPRNSPKTTAIKRAMGSRLENLNLATYHLIDIEGPREKYHYSGWKWIGNIKVKVFICLFHGRS